LNKKRMETTDEEITAGALDLIERQQKAGEHQLDPAAAVLSYTTKTFSAFNCWQARVIADNPAYGAHGWGARFAVTWLFPK
jgi:hypothetical protein